MTNSVDLKAYGADALAALVPMPAKDANKYSRGRLALVAGSKRYPGAACMAAAAAQRAGAGYVQVYAHAASVPIVQASRPSLVAAPWAGLSVDCLPVAREGRPGAVAIGCGFDAQGADEPALLRFVLENAQAPVLVDGGALGMLAKKKARAAAAARAERGAQTVLTPHGGEAARLAAPFDLPQGDDVRLAAELAQAYGAVVALKGPVTTISDGRQVYVMRQGTPALAKAGTGDVLAGIIGGLLAQGIAPFDACVLGCTLHARAGVAAANRLTDVCVCPEDVIDSLPDAIRAVSGLSS